MGQGFCLSRVLAVGLSLIILIWTVGKGHIAASGADAKVESGPATSPISIRNLTGSGNTAPTEILSLAKNLMGDGPSHFVSSHEAILGDTHPFGAPEESKVRIIHYDSVRVDQLNGAGCAYVELRLAFDLETDKLLLAFTEPLEDWVLPVLPPKDPEARARANGWFASVLESDSLSSSVPEVLEALWHRTGLRPSEVGQIVLRPRLVDNRFPAKSVDGELEPTLEPAATWIVHILGTVFTYMDHPDGRMVHLTSFIAQFVDGDLEFVRGIPLP